MTLFGSKNQQQKKEDFKFSDIFKRKDKPEKEVVTVEKVITPTIAIAQKPKPIKMLDAKIVVITEKNLQEVIKKTTLGDVKE